MSGHLGYARVSTTKQTLDGLVMPGNRVRLAGHPDGNAAPAEFGVQFLHVDAFSAAELG